jgi:hypothetical protein
VTYTIVMPDPMRHELEHSLGLSFEVIDELYANLEGGLTSEELDRCSRLAAPSPTFILNIDIQDPIIIGIKHSFTFFLTFGEKDDCLYIRSGHHAEKEDWGDS